MAIAAKSASKKRMKSRPKYRYSGTTSDGVKIIRPTVKATHFTPKQIREAIIAVRRASAVEK
jgi:hypothetical protein